MPAASTAPSRTGQRPLRSDHSSSKVMAGDAAGRQCVGCQASCTPFSSSQTGTTGAMSRSLRGKLHQARACLSPSVTSTTWLEPRRARGVPIVHPPLIVSPVPIGVCVCPGRTLQRGACVGLAVPDADSAATTDRHIQRSRRRPQARSERFKFNSAYEFVHQFPASIPECERPRLANMKRLARFQPDSRHGREIATPVLFAISGNHNSRRHRGTPAAPLKSWNPSGILDVVLGRLPGTAKWTQCCASALAVGLRSSIVGLF